MPEKCGQSNCNVHLVNIQHACAIALQVLFLWLQFCALLVGLNASSNGALEPRGVITQTMECSVG